MSLENTLNLFGTKVIDSAKRNLQKEDKAGGKLEKTLDYKVIVSPNSFQFNIYAEDYWTYVNYGVKGVGGKKADKTEYVNGKKTIVKGEKWKVKRVTNNKYRYRDKMPPTRVFSNWSVRKGLAPRNKKGQFTTRKGLMFALAKSVYHTGIETTNFLTKPFEDQFKSFPDEVVEIYGLTVENLLKTTIK